MRKVLLLLIVGFLTGCSFTINDQLKSNSSIESSSAIESSSSSLSSTNSTSSSSSSSSTNSWSSISTISSSSTKSSISSSIEGKVKFTFIQLEYNFSLTNLFVDIVRSTTIIFYDEDYFLSQDEIDELSNIKKTILEYKAPGGLVDLRISNFYYIKEATPDPFLEEGKIDNVAQTFYYYVWGTLSGYN